MTVTREEGRRVRCGACGAQPGEKCWTPSQGPREANHQERVDLFIASRDRLKRAREIKKITQKPLMDAEQRRQTWVREHGPVGESKTGWRLKPRRKP